MSSISLMRKYVFEKRLNSIYGFITCFGQRNGHNIEIKEETNEPSSN